MFTLFRYLSGDSVALTNYGDALSAAAYNALGDVVAKIETRRKVAEACSTANKEVLLQRLNRNFTDPGLVFHKVARVARGADLLLTEFHANAALVLFES